MAQTASRHTASRHTASAGKTGHPISDRNSPWNEAFSFTPEQYARLKMLRPDLFDRTLEPQVRRQKWIDFGNSPEGRAFRWR